MNHKQRALMLRISEMDNDLSVPIWIKLLPFIGNEICLEMVARKINVTYSHAYKLSKMFENEKLLIKTKKAGETIIC